MCFEHALRRVHADLLTAVAAAPADRANREGFRSDRASAHLHRTTPQRTGMPAKTTCHIQWKLDPHNVAILYV
jgi:hypothetical protein